MGSLSTFGSYACFILCRTTLPNAGGVSCLGRVSPSIYRAQVHENRIQDSLDPVC